MKQIEKCLFNSLNISKIPYDARGVYSFWFGNRCIYIGQAKNQRVRDRLLQHFKGSHNQILNLWINAYGGQLEFCCYLTKPHKINFLEKLLIRAWKPVANRIMYTN